MRNSKGQFLKGNDNGGNGFKKGHKTYNKGTKGVSKPNKTSFNSKNVGEKNAAWVGGVIGYQKRQAKIRDDYVCQMCGLREPEIMVVDHIRPKSIRPDLNCSLDNLMTLCPNCHARKTKIDFKIITIFKKEKSYE